MPRDFLFLNCQVQHDWRSTGGANAGCGPDCSCSVPVHECAGCGDCDYGQNEEADEIRRDCPSRYEMLNPPAEILPGDTGNAWAEPAMTGNLPVAGSPTISENANANF